MCASKTYPLQVLRNSVSLSSKSTLRFVALLGLIACSKADSFAEDHLPAQQWLRLDPLPGEMRLTARESFDGVPPRFVVLTDGSVFVGGRRIRH